LFGGGGGVAKTNKEKHALVSWNVRKFQFPGLFHKCWIRLFLLKYSRIKTVFLRG